MNMLSKSICRSALILLVVYAGVCRAKPSQADGVDSRSAELFVYTDYVQMARTRRYDLARLGTLRFDLAKMKFSQADFSSSLTLTCDKSAGWASISTSGLVLAVPATLDAIRVGDDYSTHRDDFVVSGQTQLMFGGQPVDVFIVSSKDSSHPGIVVDIQVFFSREIGVVAISFVHEESLYHSEFNLPLPVATDTEVHLLASPLGLFARGHECLSEG